MPRLPHSSRFDHPNNIWWWVQIIKFLVIILVLLHQPKHYSIVKAVNLWVHTVYTKNQALPILKVPNREQGMCIGGIVTVCMNSKTHQCHTCLCTFNVEYFSYGKIKQTWCRYLFVYTQ
jgi:hypothetical protein